MRTGIEIKNRKSNDSVLCLADVQTLLLLLLLGEEVDKLGQQPHILAKVAGLLGQQPSAIGQQPIC